MTQSNQNSVQSRRQGDPARGQTDQWSRTEPRTVSEEGQPDSHVQGNDTARRHAMDRDPDGRAGPVKASEKDVLVSENREVTRPPRSQARSPNVINAHPALPRITLCTERRASGLPWSNPQLCHLTGEDTGTELTSPNTGCTSVCTDRERTSEPTHQPSTEPPGAPATAPAPQAAQGPCLVLHRWPWRPSERAVGAARL